MSVIYFDVFAGISGDMCLGALVDAGCPLDEIKSRMAGLEIPGFDLTHERVERGVLAGTKVHVHIQEEHHVHRHLSDVLSIVDRVSWPGKVRQQIEAAFTQLAKAEGHVHGRPYDKVHFHEVGMYDAIVDVSATILGLHLMGIDEYVCSKIHVGEGFAFSAHGKVPVPVPASTFLLQGFEVYSSGRPFEMVTPTGAAIVNSLAHCSNTMPPMNLKAIGYGAGSRDPEDLPNMLRVFVGERGSKSADRVVVIESNIDDMNPEHYEPLLENLFAVGALDVTLSPAMMKKNRPGQVLSVIASPAHKEEIAQLILQQSTSIGVRIHECERRILQRRPVEVETQWGKVRGKVAWGLNIAKRFSPEYGDCQKLHQNTGVPIGQIYQDAIRAYEEQQPEPRESGSGHEHSHGHHHHHHEHNHGHSHGHHHHSHEHHHDHDNGHSHEQDHSHGHKHDHKHDHGHHSHD